MDTQSGKSSAIEHIDHITGDAKHPPSTNSSPVHTTPELVGISEGAGGKGAEGIANDIQASKGGWFAYFKTRNFYLVLLLGYGVTKACHLN